MSDNKKDDIEGAPAVPPNLAQGHPFSPPPAEPDSRQEENWRLMTILQMPWRDAEGIKDKKDRDFLLEKANEVEAFLQIQQQVQMQHQQAQGEVQQPSPIIQPSMVQPQVDILKP